jgi:predicted metalloprotease
MKYLAMSAAAVAVLACGAAGANQAALAKDASAPAVLAQNDAKKSDSTADKVKKEVKSDAKSVKKSVKRTWKKLTGYKFAVACPALIPISHSTCTETGKNKAAAQAKCQAQSPLCSVTPAN